MMTQNVSVASESMLHETALFSEMATFAARILPNATSDPAQSRRDSLMIAAAESIGADILITHRESVLAGDERVGRSITAASPSNAIALIGLYLRARGDFLRGRGSTVKLTASKTAFYEAAVLHFAPKFVNVLHHLGAAEAAGLRQGVFGNGASALRRARRSFERRDRLWVLSNQAHEAGVAEDALAEFEVLLTSLVGVLDPLAKVAEEVLELGTGRRDWVGWQKSKWRAAVKKADLVLGAVFAGESEAGRVLIVLTELRNLIHAEGLDVASHGDGRHSQRTWFTIPSETVATIRQATGGFEFGAAWDFTVTPSGYWLAEPGPLADRLVVGVMEAIDVITRRLETVLQQVVAAPPVRQPVHNVELVDKHVGWLLGFEEPAHT